MPKILVTGGLGYIGSHTVVALQEAGFKVVIIDNLSNSTLKVLEGIVSITGVKPEFENFDLKEKNKIQEFLQKHDDISNVIHFAASKAVGESVEKPLLYYENNINTLVYLLQELNKKESINFLFSSSCTVYGQADVMPITEESPIKQAESPYGKTKQIGETIIADICKANKRFNAIALRYFNPIGAHKSAKIGELPTGVPQNLVPYIMQTGVGKRKQLSVFGNNYPTKDGTCIRDYIHVEDVASAHVIAIQRLLNKGNKSNLEIFNLGTGKGSTVLEVVKSFERVANQKLNYKIVERRQGDIMSAYADTSKANTILGWKAKFTLDEAILSAWKWQKTL